MSQNLTIDHNTNAVRMQLRQTMLKAWGPDATYSSGIIPSFSSARKNGSYRKMIKKFYASTQVQERGVSTVPPLISYEMSDANYSITSKHLAIAVTSDEIAEALDPLKPIRDASEVLAKNFAVKTEVDFTDAFYKTGVWKYEAKGVVTDNVTFDETQLGSATKPTFTQFDSVNQDADFTGTKPQDVILDAIDQFELQTNLAPNVILIPQKVAKALRKNIHLMDLADQLQVISGTEGLMINTLAAYTGLPASTFKIVKTAYHKVSGTTLAARSPGVIHGNLGHDLTSTIADEASYMLDDGILMMYNEPSFNNYASTAACCFKNDGLMSQLNVDDSSLMSGHGIDSPNLMIRSYFDKTNFTHYIQGYMAYKNKVVAPTLGMYLDACIAG